MSVLNRKITKSLEYWGKSVKIIPDGTQCISKGPRQFVMGVYPIFLKSSIGCRTVDVDGNEYIDYIMGLGSVVLGYGYPRVNKAVAEQLGKGTNFSLLNPLELEVSELLTGIISCAEMVRFGKNGSDVDEIAVRIARAYTGREKVAYCGYHGYHDWFAITTHRRNGVPRALEHLVVPFEYNKIETLEQIFQKNKNQICAVIMEPARLEAPKENFLQNVKELAHENGALLIFDEVITGFRFALGGAQEYFGVTPDLATFGKGMSNGFPISAIVGKTEYMKRLEKDVLFTSTFGSETVSLAAAKATIQEMKEKDVLRHLWTKGEQLFDGLNKIFKDLGLEAECIGFPIRVKPIFKDKNGRESAEIKGLFLQEAVKRGILAGYYDMRPSYAHRDEEIEETLLAWKEALSIVKKGIDEGRVSKMIQGKLSAKPFSIRR